LQPETVGKTFAEASFCSLAWDNHGS